MSTSLIRRIADEIGDLTDVARRRKLPIKSTFKRPFNPHHRGLDGLFSGLGKKVVQNRIVSARIKPIREMIRGLTDESNRSI
ncbi:hypothetical protein A4W86_08010 [Latilactobacillus sakei]|nr:hypothetical protein A4W86_08010 [Latilactobacillus sakei]